jgi:hypothetical protein
VVGLIAILGFFDGICWRADNENFADFCVGLPVAGGGNGVCGVEC